MKQVLTLLFFLTQNSFAQTDTLNQKDSLGLKQGYWIFYGKDMPERNYPADGKVEEGRYLDNKKTGTWILYHNDGITPRTTGTFVNGRPNGIYTKYNGKGNILETGYFENGKRIGTNKIFYPSGCLASEKFYNQNGKSEGWGIHYYDNCDITTTDSLGKVEFKCQWVNGIRVGEATWYYPNGCVKEKFVYDEFGNLISSEKFVDNCIDSTGKQVTTIEPHAKKDRISYQEIINDEGEVLMEGEFKNGKLWNGKLYKYDSDGILLKIEIWKNGAYHSDGQL